MISSFYPAISGRASTSQARFGMLYQIQSDTSSIQRLQQQLSTGRRLAAPSDDLPAAIRAIGIQASKEFKVQVTENLSTSDSYMNTTDISLGQVQDILTSARGTALSSVDNTLTDAQRKALSQEVSNSLSRIVEVANTKFRDRYLLAGSRLRQAPMELNSGTVEFTGDTRAMQTIADFGVLLPANVTAQDSLGVISTAREGIVDLNPSVQPFTPLDSLNAGLGVSPGLVRFSNGVNYTDIDFSKVETLSDVLDTINNSDINGRRLRASLTANSLRLEYSDGLGGLLRVQDLNAGTTAAKLGIRTNPVGAATPITGSDLNPTLDMTTNLDQFFNGAGINLNQGFQIIQNGKTFVVNTSNAVTVEDLLNSIENSGASVIADIAPNRTGLRIRSTQSGSDFSIGENGGSMATVLGLRSFAGTTKLSELNYGRGVEFGLNADLSITRNDGSLLQIDLKGSKTVADVINKINLDPNNQVPATRISASLVPTGNGLQLTSPAGSSAVVISPGGGSQAAYDLGLIPNGQQSTSFSVAGANQSLVGRDTSVSEVRGAFNSLIRLQNAIDSADQPSIERAVKLLDEDLERISFSRAELGARQQRVDQLKTRTEDQINELTSSESKELDTDFTSIVSELQAKQIAQQASLKLIGQSAGLSLFNFL